MFRNQDQIGGAGVTVFAVAALLVCGIISSASQPLARAGEADSSALPVGSKAEKECFRTLGGQEKVVLADGEVTAPFGGSDPPWGEILFVNGFGTSQDDAIAAAELIAQQLGGYGVRLVWNDLTVPAIDIFTIWIEKWGTSRTSVNAATRTLIERTRRNAEQGQTTWLIGHSAGTLCQNNAMNELDRQWTDHDKRWQLMQRVKVVTLGSAVLMDGTPLAHGWPEWIPVFHIFDEFDWVSQLFGPAKLIPKDDRASHSLFGRYIPWLSSDAFGETGYLVVRDNQLVLKIVTSSVHGIPRIRASVRRGRDGSYTTERFAIPAEWEHVWWSIDVDGDTCSLSLHPVTTSVEIITWPWLRARTTKVTGPRINHDEITPNPHSCYLLMNSVPYGTEVVVRLEPVD